MANYTQMLLDLRSHQESLDQAIHAVERLAIGGKKRRGRPPAWMQTLKRSDVQTSAPRRRFSVETRRKMAQAQKARWAKRQTA